MEKFITKSNCSYSNFLGKFYSISSVKAFFGFLFVFASLSSNAANPLSIGGANFDKINLGSGENYLIIGGINDNDLVDQSITFTAASNNTNLISVIGVSYVTGHSAAVITFRDLGERGNAVITLTGSDGDGSVSKAFNVNVGANYPAGLNFGIYDIIFWLRTVPNEQQPVASTVTPSASVTDTDPILNGIDITNLPLTVGCDCYSCCGGTKKGSFYTTGYSGVIVPTATGIYLFTVDFQDGVEFWLGNDANIPTEYPVPRRGFQNWDARNGNTISDTAWLVANKPYGFRAANFVVFSERFSLKMSYQGTNPNAVTTVTALSLGLVATSTPGFNAATQGKSFASLAAGITKDNIFNTGAVISSPFVYTTFDPIPPASPTELVSLRKSTASIDIKWKKPIGETTNPFNGYKIYVNGTLNRTLNGTLNTASSIYNLLPGVPYTIMVTAFDLSGNESAPSNIIFESTFNADISAPSAPNLVVDTTGDMSARISWTGASDNESGIYGYKVYVKVGEGSLTGYNTDTANVSSMILKTYLPNTLLTVEVEAYNGAGLISPRSSPIDITLLSFDPLVPSPGVKKGAVNFMPKFIGNSDGWGINAAWEDEEDYNTAAKNLLKELNAKQIRWGALNANPYRFEDKIGLTAKRYAAGNALTYVAQGATTNGVSYGKFIKLAEELGITASIAIGTDSTPASDWRLDPELTAKLFVAYIGGSLNTPGISEAEKGVINKRLQEGYSAPLLANTKGIIIEFGNEPWGGTNKNGSTDEFADHNSDRFRDYNNYGVWCRRLANGFKSSVFFDSTKIKLYYSGRYSDLDESYGLHEKMVTRTEDEKSNGIVDKVDGISVAGYMGGNLGYDPLIPKGKSEGDYYKNSFEVMARRLNGFNPTIDMDYLQSGKKRPFYFYESNMTRAEYNKRLGQAIMMTDYFVSGTKYGLVYPCMFQLDGGEWGISDGSLRFPWFHMGKYINTHAKGQLLKSSVASLDKVTNEKGVGLQLEPVSANMFYENGAYKLVLISRDFENSFNTQLNFPVEIGVPNTAKKYMITGTDFSTSSVIIDSADISFSNNVIVEVPKHSMIIITFSGNNLDATQMPLGYNAYRSPTSVAINYEVTDGYVDEEGILVQIPRTAIFTISREPSDAIVELTWKVLTPDATVIPTIKASRDTLSVQFAECFEGTKTISIAGNVMDEPEFANPIIKEIQISSTIDKNGDPCPGYSSTKKGESSKLFKVYPNPSTGSVTLESSINGNYKIYSIQGNLIKAGKLGDGILAENMRLNAGLYVVTFSNSNTSITRKLIVTH